MLDDIVEFIIEFILEGILCIGEEYIGKKSASSLRKILLIALCTIVLIVFTCIILCSNVLWAKILIILGDILIFGVLVYCTIKTFEKIKNM